MLRIKLFGRYPLHTIDRATGTTVLFCALAFQALYIVSRYNYNLFHGLADIFTIVIASTVFAVAWNSRDFIDNNYLLYAGIAFLSFAFLDLLHVLGNKNMGVFPQYGNLGPTLYIASRYVLSLSLLTAPLFINRKLKVVPVFAVYSLVTLLVLLSVFYWQNFPACFVEGVGLTTFKVMSDYIICVILLGALVLLLLNRRSFDARVLRLLAASILLSIASGLAFTLYADPFGVMNAVGHFLQIISFYLIYLAIIETGLTKPQNILFRKLNQSEERLRLLGDNLPDSAVYQYVHELDGRIRFLYFSAGIERLNGVSVADVLRDAGTLRRQIPPEYIQQWVEAEARSKRELSNFDMEVPMRRSDGEIRWMRLHSRPRRLLDGRTAWDGVQTDITERKAAEAALEKAHEELEQRVQERTSELSEAVQRLRAENMLRRQLEETLRESEAQVRFFASQCLTAQETERKRVAGELHDSIAASLGAVKFRIDKIAEEMKQGNGGSESLPDVGAKVMEINTEVRRIMADLRPSVLDDLGIVAALNWFCREYQKTYSHISVDKQAEISENDVPDSLKTPIFRICQEAMNNTAKYSKATLVNLSLRKKDDKILLEVQDDGHGFDLNTVRKGLGLSTMRERAELSAGSFEIESSLGKGTVIRVSWPLRQSSAR